MTTFKYKALRVRQTNSGNWLVLFAASAIEIEQWVGIPQKKKIGDQETTGFQREENPKRIREIRAFYQNEQNIIQNPLLCALRQTSQGSIDFEPNDSNDDNYIQHGDLTIVAEPLEQLSLLELLKRVKQDLESRVPTLNDETIPDSLITKLKRRAVEEGQFDLWEQLDESDALAQSNDNDNDNDNNDNEEDSDVRFSDESHILDFWQEISAYIYVLEEIQDFQGYKFIDYTKESMIAFLRPVVVVDGQHRLRAAIASTKELIKEDKYKEKIEDEILNNPEADSEEIQREIEIGISRKLPISLLINNDPAEQVFQFVVVNQKATPIKHALLGTIVSTSLSNEELARVEERLEKAGIKLDESRAITYLLRHPRSPFLGLVERGLKSDGKDLLNWRVLASIVGIFRDLKGGQLFHERIDYADKWKRYHLEESPIIKPYNDDENCQTAFEYWSKLDGPWREIFIEFWIKIRDKLADKDNDQAWHYWGNPKQSNIFNKTSLTILSADFFQHLTDKEILIEGAEQIDEIVGNWLKGVNTDYFNRDWNLHGIKKDVPGIRKRWSTEWVQYRKDPRQLPKNNIYRNPHP